MMGIFGSFPYHVMRALWTCSSASCTLLAYTTSQKEHSRLLREHPRIHRRLHRLTKSTAVPHENIDPEIKLLVAGWKLGCRLRADAFQDAIVDHLCEKVRADTGALRDAYKLVYHQTTETNLLRDLIKDVAAYGLRPAAKAIDEAKYGKFLQDVLSTTQDKEEVAPYSRSDCTYHVHKYLSDDPRDCYKMKYWGL
jgi:hypothetical protein